MNNKIKIYGVALGLCVCATFFPGCSGSKNPSQTISGGLDDKTQILKIIAETPYGEVFEEAATSHLLSKNKNLLPADVASVVRSAIQISRDVTSISFNDMDATVEATFSISGTLSFKNSQGSSAAEKPISIQATGSYKLSKDSAGAWLLKENAADGLIFISGDILVRSFSLSPTFPNTGDTVTFTIKLSTLSTSSPEFSGNIYFKYLNLKIQLLDDGISGDAVANDGIFTAQFVFPSSLPDGRYVLGMDIIEKTGSFDITKSSTGSIIKGYNGIFATQGILIGDLQSISISTKQDTGALKAGSLAFFTAKAAFSPGDLDVTRLVSWNSSNTSVGTVNPAGIFLAVSPGTTEITASDGGFTSNTIGINVK